MFSLLDVTSLVVFVFGALAFSTLTLFYWGERRPDRHPRHTVFPAFTLVCAVAFLAGLAAQTGLAPGIALSLRSLAVGLLPPLLLHLVLENAGNSPRVRSARRWLLPVFYGASVALALARVLRGAGILYAPWSDALYLAPAAALAAGAAVGLACVSLLWRPDRPAERAHRLSIGILLALMLACAAATFADTGAWVGQVPDYLLLAFFSFSLYYRERLVFFDVLMKRGAFLAIGLAACTATIAAAGRSLALSESAIPWLYAIGLLLWLAAPSASTLVASAIDRLWLRRPYSIVAAERQFIHEVQASASVEDLHSRARASLAAIFQTSAQVCFDPAAPHAVDSPESLSAVIEHSAARQGFIQLAPRPNGVPFLSDDRRLLESLAATLGMVLENVRFRADRRRQEQREQQLRLLASRAELKALRAQINPHFLFNALSVISGLMQYQPELADETIERLAQVFRYTLRKSDNEWTPLGEEVEFITAYLAIEQARFGERLQVEFDIDPAAARIPIPAMSIQPLVENAVKHGLSASEGRGTVGLRAALQDGRLSVEVCDDGPGFPPDFSLQEPGDSHGLRNVAERLRGYYGDAARLSWDSDGARTSVRLTFPQAVAAGEDR